MSEISGAIDGLVTRSKPYGEQPHGARLIVGVYDDPDDGSDDTIPRPADQMGSGENEERTVLPALASSLRGGDMQLITARADPSDAALTGAGHAIISRGVPSVSASGPGTSGTGTGSVGGDMGLIGAPGGPPDGSTGSVGTVAANSPTTSAGTPDPASAFAGAGAAGSFHDMRIISEPVGLPGADSENAAANYGGSSQLHQLVAAMASFGENGAGSISAAAAQTEVEAARTTLAASLHF